MFWYPKLMDEDRNGNLWISDNQAVYKYRNGKVTRYNFQLHALSENFQRSFAFF